MLLIVEVSDTTLSYDRKMKLPRYAAAGIPECWIADLKNNRLHVYRGPQTYKAAITLHPGEVVSPLAFPDVQLRIHDILSTDCEEE